MAQWTLEEIIKDETRAAIREALITGYIEGLKAYAWWKDGVQYVGTCGTTLEAAIQKATEGYKNDR